VAELDQMAYNFKEQVEAFRAEAARQERTRPALRGHFVDAVSEKWHEAGFHIQEMSRAARAEDKDSHARQAISAVIRTLSAAQREAWVAQNVLEGLKRGDSPTILASNMEVAGVIPQGYLSGALQADPQIAGQKMQLAESSHWILARAKKVLLLLAGILERILAAVAAFIHIEPRIGVGLGIVPTVDISWNAGAVSAKELIGAVVKGFD